MRKTVKRSAVVAVAAAATTAGLLGSFVSSASAAPGDPITGGTTTIAAPLTTVQTIAKAGVYFVPLSPASVGYDATNKALDLMLPVSGGDGSFKADFGSIQHSGSIKVSDYKTHRSVTLTNFTLGADTLQLSATPSTGGNPVVIADLTGSNTFSSDPVTNYQTLDSTEISVDAAGAAYLDKALCTKAFTTGQSLGSFDTTFLNTQY